MIFKDPIGWLRSSVGTKSRLTTSIIMQLIFGMIIYDHFYTHAISSSKDPKSIFGFIFLVGIFAPILQMYAGYRALQEFDKKSPPQTTEKESSFPILAVMFIAAMLLFCILIQY